MKKIKYLLLVCLLMFVGILQVNAAGFTVSRSTNSTTIGNTVSITVNANGGAGWEYCVSYNQEVFKLTSANSDTGGACVKTGSTLIGYASVTFKFQAIKTGSSTFSVSGQMYNDNGEAISTEGASTKIEVRAKEDASKQISSQSSNANLRVLEVAGYKIVPDFNKNVTEYTLEVDGSVEEVQVNAYREDTSSNISPIDMVELKEGINKVTVVVTAQNGNKKTYTITITRGEKKLVEVTVDGKEYSVVTTKGVLDIPGGYKDTTITIDGNEVPAYVNDDAKIVLVVLKDENDKMNYFIYKDGNFISYDIISSNSISIVPTDSETKIEGYVNKKNIQIDGKDVEVYYKNEDDSLVLVYGKSIVSGKEDWYYYDINDGAMIKYDNNLVNVKGAIVDKDKNVDYKMLAVVFALVSGFSLLLVIALSIMNSKLKNKNEEMFTYIEDKIRRRNEKKFSKILDLEKNDELVELDKTIEKTMEIEEEEEEVDDEEYEDEEIDDDIELEYEEEEEEEENVHNTITHDIELEPKNDKKKVNKKIATEEDIVKNIAKANNKSFDDEEEKPRKKSRRELRLEKKREKALAKKARQEFLDDKTFEESAFDVYTTDSIPIVGNKIQKKGKKK